MGEWLQLTRLQAVHKAAGAIKSGGACAIIRIVERSDDVCFSRWTGSGRRGVKLALLTPNGPSVGMQARRAAAQVTELYRPGTVDRSGAVRRLAIKASGALNFIWNFRSRSDWEHWT
jgi:hypothetical protein